VFFRKESRKESNKISTLFPELFPIAKEKALGTRLVKSELIEAKM